MADTSYPRDLVGYGRTPPHPRWPDGARIAVQFVINYEEGGENSILHGDRASEAFLSEIVGAAPWPGQRHMSMESIYEYGSRVGFWRLWRMFTLRDMPVTVFGVATALQRNPDAVAAMKEAGWEIASHGLKWIDYRDFSSDEERAHLREAIRDPYRGDRRAPARLVHRAHVRAHQPARGGGGRISLHRRFLRRRASLLGAWAEGPAAHRALHPRCQRHALRHTAGFQRGRPVLRLPEGQFRYALRGRRRQPEDALGRPPLPPGRAPGTGGGARPLPRPCRVPSTTCGLPDGSTSPGTGCATTGPSSSGPAR